MEDNAVLKLVAQALAKIKIIKELRTAHWLAGQTEQELINELQQILEEAIDKLSVFNIVPRGTKRS